MKNTFARWFFAAMALLLFAHSALGKAVGALQPTDMRESMLGFGLNR